MFNLIMNCNCDNYVIKYLFMCMFLLKFVCLNLCEFVSSLRGRDALLVHCNIQDITVVFFIFIYSKINPVLKKIHESAHISKLFSFQMIVLIYKNFK